MSQKKQKIMTSIIKTIQVKDIKDLQSLFEIIKDDRQILEFLQLLIHLTSIDDTLIQCGQFFGCNFSELNLNRALLFNCKWKNLRNHELDTLEGHNSTVLSVCFSPDGTSYWMLKQDNTTTNQMVIFILSTQYASLLMLLYQRLIVTIILYVYGILKYKRKFNPPIILIKIYQHHLKPTFKKNNLLSLSLFLLHFFYAHNYILKHKKLQSFQGEFTNHQVKDLRYLFINRGACILENWINLQQEAINQ
ncbi:unnamed protein product [Paramecium primaurelia]|uniref:Transmembrane protein n=1 Tax=Paramecium primaurelia TaxID=5886 RepID=A0A8S1NQ67_PARPR|nr:unnamed protein product [Paramecium primaurelia]